MAPVESGPIEMDFGSGSGTGGIGIGGIGYDSFMKTAIPFKSKNTFNFGLFI
jgi:hypothetical protein